jgi:peptidoglycan/xylan/chitin deacetylase (PgdA/CDA1 family)
MGHVAGRFVVAAALLLATSYLLQADDSLAAAARPAQAAGALKVPVVQVDPILTVRAGSGDREYFISRHEIVPLGADSLRLPILMYHYVRKPPSSRVDPLGFKLSVAAADFQAQMDWLHAHGYHPVNFNEVRSYFAGARPLPSRPVVMTFDDGYQDLYSTAFPILKSHGFTAVAYIVSGFVDWPNYVTRGQVLEMDRAGIQIASHTVHHPNLAHMGFGTVMNEVAQSKQWLEQLLGHPVLDFAYPSGQFSTQTVEAVRQAGYSTAVTTDRDSTIHSLADRFTWGRVRVGGGESLQDFATKLGPSMPSVIVSSVEVESNTSPPLSG